MPQAVPASPVLVGVGKVGGPVGFVLHRVLGCPEFLYDDSCSVLHWGVGGGSRWSHCTIYATVCLLYMLYVLSAHIRVCVIYGYISI